MSTPSGVRAYRLLLRLFPRRFRRERGSEMESLFLDMRRERAVTGSPTRVAFWLRIIWDTCSQALHERLAPSRFHSPTPHAFRIGEVMSTILGDIRYVVRTLIRQPTFGFMVIAMVAIGIAGNAAVFRIVNGLFIRPLPFANPDQLVDLDETAPQWNLEFVGIAHPDFLAWRRDNQTFQSMAVFTTRGANFAGAGEPERIEAVFATFDIADVLAIEPVLGRFFTSEEDMPDAPLVGLLSHSFWRRQFGGDPAVVGRSVSVSGRSFDIIGVLPPEAEFVSDAEVWVPLREDGRSAFYLEGVGRLKSGVSLEQARADLLSAHRGLIEERSVNDITSPVVHSIRDRFLGEYRNASTALMAAVVVVLLIACANIAGLMLARSLVRSREIGIRMAMGARTRRIVRQLLTESLLLAVVGGILGTALGYWGSSLLVNAMTDQFPPWVMFDLDWRFVGFAAAATLGAAVVFGLLPAVQSAGVDIGSVLQASSTRASSSARKRRSMSFLVMGEIALALVLLIVAGLAVRDVRELYRIDPGYRAENLLTFRVGLPGAEYGEDAQQVAFVDELLPRLRALPGAEAVTIASMLPLGGHSGWFFEVDGLPDRGPDDPNPVVLNRAVTPGYFETMGVTIVRGRAFEEFDGRDEGSRAAIVNETFVRLFIPGDRDPLGMRIRAGGSDWMTIVGVNRDVKHYGVDEEMRPGVYQPMAQFPDRGLQLAIRTAGEPTAMLQAARREVQAIHSELALYEIATAKEQLDESLWSRRALSWLIGAFSTVALVLAVAGIYGVVSYTVGQRAHEISIRMALGAKNAQVLRQVMKHGMLIVGIGVVVGLGVAYAAAQFVSSILVGVSAKDPFIYMFVTVLLVIVAAVANLVPAWRAAGLEPMNVLRSE